MLNREPIIIHGFARGGTNILLNLLLSHPDVCTTQGEIHQVIRGGATEDTPLRALQKRLCYDLPLRHGVGVDFFGNGLYRERLRIPAWAARYADMVFFIEKMLARHEGLNRYKAEGVRYRPGEIARSRLVLKGLHATLLATEILRQMYPDAVFLALVRNGLAICEGQLRRGRPPEWTAQRYRFLADRMLAYAEQLPGFHVVRYEDIISEPRSSLERIYRLARLDAAAVTRVRFQVKRTLDADGRHLAVGGAERQVVWFDLDEMSRHLSPEVNENQIRRLPPEARRTFLEIAGDTMTHLGYAI